MVLVSGSKSIAPSTHHKGRGNGAKKQPPENQKVVRLWGNQKVIIVAKSA